MSTRKTMAAIAAVMLLGSMITIAPATLATTGVGDTRVIHLGGTGAPITGEHPASGPGDVTNAEFPGEEDAAPGVDAYNGVIDRSLSTGHGHGVSATSTRKAKSNPTFNFGFEGLNHYQQRYARGGNQFSVGLPIRDCASGADTSWNR